MRKKLQYQYTYLTLLKQDIKELIELFQTHLQDVEITIDGIHILDAAQLEQFVPHHLVQSLRARGYYHEAEVGQATSQSDPPLIELNMRKPIMVLRCWQEAGRGMPEVFARIHTMLAPRVNRTYQLWTVSVSMGTLCTFVSLQGVAQQHHLNFIAQLLLEIGGIPIAYGAFCLFVAITHLLNLDTRVFLFPADVESTRTYGKREVIGAVVVGLSVLVLVSFIVPIAFHILWR